jgi:hypothetical protein
MPNERLICEERYRQMFPADEATGSREPEQWQVVVLHARHSPAFKGNISDLRNKVRSAIAGHLVQRTKLVAKVATEYSRLFSARTEPIQAQINGKLVLFATYREKFYELATECYNMRQAGSSTALFQNDAYGQIVGMGWEAVPFLLDEIAHHRGHWFTALTWITGFDPVTSDMQGNIRRIRQAWTEWGSANGYHLQDSQGELVSKVSERNR